MQENHWKLKNNDWTFFVILWKLMKNCGSWVSVEITWWYVIVGLYSMQHTLRLCNDMLVLQGYWIYNQILLTKNFYWKGDVSLLFWKVLLAYFGHFWLNWAKVLSLPPRIYIFKRYAYYISYKLFVVYFGHFWPNCAEIWIT